LHQVSDLFELNVILRCQKFNDFFPILETKLKAQRMNTPASLNWFI